MRTPDDLLALEKARAAYEGYCASIVEAIAEGVLLDVLLDQMSRTVAACAYVQAALADDEVNPNRTP